MLYLLEQADSCDWFYLIIQMQEAKTKIVGWYEQQPFFSKTYVAISISLSLLATLDLISAYHLFYTFQETFINLNLWRPITAMIFMGKIDYVFCVSVLVMYLTLRNLQKSHISKKQYQEFIWLIILIFGSCIVIGSIIDLYFFTEIFIMSTIVISSYFTNKISLLKLKFEIKERKVYLLIATIIYGLCMAYIQKRYTPYIIGILLGFLYLFVKLKLQVYVKTDLLSAPGWLQKWWQVRSRHTSSPNRHTAKAEYD